MQDTISSKKVAEVLGKRHDNFMRDIRKYMATLEEDAPKYFLENEGSGKRGVCYDITPAGCELIAGRMIGSKGNAFREFIVRTFYEAPPMPMQEPVEDQAVVLTVEEVAKMIGCSERNVYRMAKAGKIEGIQQEILMPTVKMFVTKASVESYLASKM